MRFIDLFAGLGGFHLALKKLGHECVFACEINKPLAQLYLKNHGIEPLGDINKVNIERDIPEHDILCGGFPCQPFSIAGKKSGKEHDSGNLFDKIVEILEAKKPRFFILENVPHIKNLDNGEMWKYMEKKFKELNYDCSDRIYSPHQFGTPQHRRRIYIVGALGAGSLENFEWMTTPKLKDNETSIHKILDKNPVDAKKIGDDRLQCLDIWQTFIDAIPKTTLMPLFPIWAAEFGATYPIDDDNYPYIMNQKNLSKCKGSFGKSFSQSTKEEQLASLPTYARVKDPFPEWKKRYIRENRAFYIKHEKELKAIVKKIALLKNPSWQKLEWNVKERERIIKNYIIQFRQSGVRIKKIDSSPTLVCTSTEIPIVGWENRYITKSEGARLQSISGIELPDSYNTCFIALGNAVNVDIISKIASQLLKLSDNDDNSSKQTR